jgi:hypothetical protein
MITTMAKSKLIPVEGKPGARWNANAFLYQLMLDGNGIFTWKEQPLKRGNLTGFLAAPGIFSTNENDAGVDVALWVGDVDQDKTGKNARHPTFKFNGKTGKRMVWYQQLIIPWDIAEAVGESIAKVARQQWGNQQKSDIEVHVKETAVDSEQAKIDAAMRKLGLLGGV